ncbi:hypothetical protein BDV95DRAFT_147200 [Massariosphaeria phaeospora]|uniref:Rhodopsin domain-containing protein n=1 Tax=Massariosphaeria phaeospora TaxID=100035 RepID=A0A7C8MH64_9PLEO|nr:hypothetical protein BDV95DRAFT_147200 [Massariosphaeria phaeospora]
MIGTVRQKAQIGLYSASLFLATVAVVCRFWSRKITGTKWQLNDYFMLLAYLSVLGLSIAANLAVTQGELGVHVSDIPKRLLPKIIPYNLKMMIVIPFFLVCSSFLVKMSITHFYIILFPNTWIQRICRVQLYLLLGCCIGGIVSCFLMCRPLAYTWNKSIPGGKCFDIKDFWLGISIVGLFFDLSLVILPIPVFWNLRMSWRKKAKLILLFGLGLFICIFSALRVYYDERMNFKDLTWTAAPAVMCTVPEPSLSVVAGCLPITVPLFTRASTAVKSSIMSRSRTILTGSRANGTDRRKSLPPNETNNFQRLHDHLYPMTAIVVSRGSMDRGAGGADETERAGPPVGRRNFASFSGIRVLSEVHVDSEVYEDLGR